MWYVCVHVYALMYTHVSSFRGSTDLDVLDGLFQSVIPEPIVDPLPDQLQGRLGPEGVLGGHVEVIHECQQHLTTNRDIHT